MPMINIYGIPTRTNEAVLNRIREDIIREFAQATGIFSTIIRVFVIPDMIGDPSIVQNNMIYCELKTSMLARKPTSERQIATSAIAEVVWQAFAGQIEVEVFIIDLNGDGKTLRGSTLTSIMFDGKEQEIVYFASEYDVAPGVLVDAYDYVGNDANDLAIVTVLPGYKTPLQKLYQGVRTIERYISGQGTFTVKTAEGETKVFVFTGAETDKDFVYSLKFGDEIQWQSASTSELVFGEFYEPRYDPGRFGNIG